MAKERPAPASEPASTTLAAGEVLGRKYRLVRAAGFGGTGVVWVAKNLATDAEVVVKLLPADAAGSKEAAVRFRREAHAAAKLSHRGIVRTFDLLELEAPHEGALLIVMELLKGETLGEAFDRQHILPLDVALDLTLSILSALSHAHAAGIVHRDIKPENIFLASDPDGHVTPKILDFGISKLESPDAPRITGDGALLGTPAYMSPEQARGSNDSDARSDLFSVGILLYEMLAGENPFAEGSYHAVVAAILERNPDPILDAPPLVWGVLSKALAKAPERRFATADAMAEALTAAKEGRALPLSIPPADAPATRPSLPQGRSTHPTILTGRAEARARSKGRSVLFTAFFAVLALAVLAVIWLTNRRATAEEETPTAATAQGGPAKMPEVLVDQLPPAPRLPSSTATASASANLAAPPRRGPRPPPPRRPRPPSAPPPAPPTSTVARDPGF